MSKVLIGNNHHFTNKLYAVFICISLFSQTLIYSVFALIGENAGNYNSYLYLLIFAILWFLFFIRLFERKTIRLKTIIAIWLSLLVLLHHLLTSDSNSNQSMLFYYIIWGITSIAAMGTASREDLVRIVGYSEIINLIQSFACIFVIIRFISSGSRIVNTISFGGETYNTLSYTAASSLGLLLFYAFFCPTNYRLLLFRKNRFSLVYSILAILLVLASFVSGGRGGAIAIIVYLLVFFVYFNRNEQNKAKKIIVDISLFAVAAIFIYEFSNNNSLSDYLLRTFSYFTNGKFDFTQTSGRETIYLEAFEEWKKKPILGYGPFNYPNGIYPHNIFLDLLVSGGIVYFVIGSIGVILPLVYAFKSFQHSGIPLFFSFVYLSTFIMLLFSGTFYSNIRFWMCITYYFCIYDGYNTKMKVSSK